jgi:hypothetical protein
MPKLPKLPKNKNMKKYLFTVTTKYSINAILFQNGQKFEIENMHNNIFLMSNFEEKMTKKYFIEEEFKHVSINHYNYFKQEKYKLRKKPKWHSKISWLLDNDEFDFSNCYVSGGALIHAIILNNKNSSIEPSDIDLFCPSKNQIQNALHNICNICDVFNKKYVMISTNFIIQMIVEDSFLIQLIRVDDEKFILNFDLDYVKCFWDGENICGTRSCCLCLRYGQASLTNNISLFKLRSKRIVKALNKGFNIEPIIDFVHFWNGFNMPKDYWWKTISDNLKRNYIKNEFELSSKSFLCEDLDKEFEQWLRMRDITQIIQKATNSVNDISFEIFEDEEEIIGNEDEKKITQFSYPTDGSQTEFRDFLSEIVSEHFYSKNNCYKLNKKLTDEYILDLKNFGNFGNYRFLIGNKIFWSSLENQLLSTSKIYSLTNLIQLYVTEDTTGTLLDVHVLTEDVYNLFEEIVPHVCFQWDLKLCYKIYQQITNTISICYDISSKTYHPQRHELYYNHNLSIKITKQNIKSYYYKTKIIYTDKLIICC